MDLSVLTVWPPPSRVEPVGRQIFGNALGMVSSQDLTVCPIHCLNASIPLVVAQQKQKVLSNVFDSRKKLYVRVL